MSELMQLGGNWVVVRSPKDPDPGLRQEDIDAAKEQE